MVQLVFGSFPSFSILKGLLESVIYLGPIVFVCCGSSSIDLVDDPVGPLLDPVLYVFSLYEP